MHKAGTPQLKHSRLCQHLCHAQGQLPVLIKSYISVSPLTNPALLSHHELEIMSDMTNSKQLTIHQATTASHISDMIFGYMLL